MVNEWPIWNWAKGLFLRIKFSQCLRRDGGSGALAQITRTMNVIPRRNDYLESNEQSVAGNGCSARRVHAVCARQTTV